jgi:hypothetical protein
MIAAGVNYPFYKLVGTSVIGKKGKTGLICITSKKALICLITKDGVNPASITSHEFVAADLIKKNF